MLCPISIIMITLSATSYTSYRGGGGGFVPPYELTVRADAVLSLVGREVDGKQSCAVNTAKSEYIAIEPCSAVKAKLSSAVDQCNAAARGKE